MSKKKTSLVTTVAHEKLDALRTEIAATLTERGYNARDEIIRAHHECGKLLHVFSKENKVPITLLVKSVAQCGAAKETTLWLSYQFVEKFPEIEQIDRLGHGKAISWNKIRKAISPDESVSKHREELHELGTLCGAVLILQTDNTDTLAYAKAFLKDVHDEVDEDMQLSLKD